jgi:hypothetical protein
MARPLRGDLTLKSLNPIAGGLQGWVIRSHELQPFRQFRPCLRKRTLQLAPQNKGSLHCACAVKFLFLFAKTYESRTAFLYPSLRDFDFLLRQPQGIAAYPLREPIHQAFRGAK